MSPPQITSAKNPRVKRALKLRDSRQREKLGRFLIDGRREIERAVAAGIEIEELFVCPSIVARSLRDRNTGHGVTRPHSGCEDECGERLNARCTAAGAHVVSVTAPVFERIAFGQRAEGLLAVAVTPQRTLADLCLGDLWYAHDHSSCSKQPSAFKNPLVVVLESIEKPGNVGAILRSADAAGVQAVIVAKPATDLYNPNTIRASLGAIFALPVVAAASEEAAAWLRRQGLLLFAARVDGALPYTAADYTGPAAIVLGSEAAGLSEVWQGPDVTAVRLPLRGTVDSLNVSAAAAVLFYEVLRQRLDAFGEL